MKFLNMILSSTLLFPSASFAAERVEQRITLSAFNALQPASLDPTQVYYASVVGDMSQWNQALHNDALALTLYPGYVEPTVMLKTGKMGIRKLRIYEYKSKVLINKAPQDIHLEELLQLPRIEKFDPEIQHEQIQTPKLLLNTLKAKPIDNFHWCNKNYPNITRPELETDLSYTQSPNRPWQCQGDHSICLESCYIFGNLWSGPIEFANASGMGTKKDFGIAMQSELRYFENENELGLPVALKTLTGLDTDVRGGIQQSIFYVNQVMEFGKLLVVLQKHPTDPSKTVMTAFFVVGVKASALDEIPEGVLLGNAPLLNSKTGISAGLPVFTQNTVKALAAEFEK